MKTRNLKVIFEVAHAVAISMNDTFYYACADAACIDIDELKDIEPVIEKHGQFAFIAYEAIKRGHDPQIPQYSEETDFKEAKAEILDIMKNATEYGKLYELRQTVKEMEAHTPKERKRISSLTSKMKDAWYSFFTHR